MPSCTAATPLPFAASPSAGDLRRVSRPRAALSVTVTVLACAVGAAAVVANDQHVGVGRVPAVKYVGCDSETMLQCGLARRRDSMRAQSSTPSSQQRREQREPHGVRASH